jgi:hypothetical protein
VTTWLEFPNEANLGEGQNQGGGRRTEGGGRGSGVRVGVRVRVRAGIKMTTFACGIGRAGISAEGGRGDPLPSLHHEKAFSRVLNATDCALSGRSKGARSRGGWRPHVWELKRGWIASCADHSWRPLCCARFPGTFQFILNVVNLCDTKHWLIPFFACICAFPSV